MTKSPGWGGRGVPRAGTTTRPASVAATAAAMSFRGPPRKSLRDVPGPASSGISHLHARPASASAAASAP
jgi:hypothetical protein